MRLLKLLAYFALGYVVYEFYRGMTDAEDGRWMDGGGEGSDDLHRALNEDTGRMMNMTGTGRGTMVSTQDSSGTSMGHVVGRGVV